MIITKTPLRISFFGGGTDYPDWFRKNGGAVLSTTINKYSYINVRDLPPFFPYKNKIVWSKIEDVNDIKDISHPSVREVLGYLNYNSGIFVQYNGDLPARSGLGSSSSFTVGLLNAIHCLNKESVSKISLAKEAIHVEQKLIKENVGSQDQIAVALGGFNKIEFGNDGKIIVKPQRLPVNRLKDLNKHMMLYFTGLNRHASEIVAEQIKNIPEKTRELETMKEMVDEAIFILGSNGDWLGQFGSLLDKAWQIKRTLSSKVSNNFIDQMYNRAMNAGALGGKLLGAGNGGFMLIYARPEDQPNIKKELSEFLYVPFEFENEGSKVLYLG